MPIDADILRRLSAIKMSREAMREVMSVVADMQAVEDERLEKQRNRKRKSRDNSGTVTGQERDEDGTVTGQDCDSHSDRFLPEVPPKNNIKPPPTQPSRSSLRSERTARAQEFAVEFDQTFWPEWPHKVGRPDAAKAFLRKRLDGVPLDAIMAGVRRYIADKPQDRPWLNPATFLNRDRFLDAPAAVAPPARASPNGRTDELGPYTRAAFGLNHEPDHHQADEPSDLLDLSRH